MNKVIHLKGLNGIRAIAAIAVVFSHINLALGEFKLPALPSLDLAGHGVTMFFALSGFLITYLLLQEKEVQEIDIKKFYWRRILRIWPLYFLYLAVSVVVALKAGLISDLFPAIFFYVFLAASVPFILGTFLPFIGHLWSIGVEEQFYLFWPWMIKLSKEKTFLIVFLFGAFFFILRLVCWFIEYKWGNPYPYLAIHITRFDCMAIGGIGGVLFFNNNKTFRTFLYFKATQILAWFVLGLLAFNKYHIASVIDPEIISVITVIIIINVCSNKDTLVNLDQPIFNFLGKLSYGIYVIHPLIIFLTSRLLYNIDFIPILKYFLVYAVVLFFTIFLSYISYEFYEKRFILLKDRFSVIKSSGNKIL